MQSRKAIASFDIAEKAGVSPATVSRAPRGDFLVSEETGRCVGATVATLIRAVHRNVSILRGKSTGTLAPLFFEDPSPDVQQDTQRAGEMLGDSLLRLIHSETVEARCCR